MRKLFILALLGVFLISFVGAEINNYAPVKQNDCILLTQTCASCSYVNVSVTYKNDTKLSNTGMTDAGGSLWTHSYCDTFNLGRYDVQGYGDLEGTATGFDVLYFEVTTSGLTGTLGFFFIILILSIGVIILGYYVEDAWIVVLGSFALVLVGLYILFFGIDGVKDTVYTWGIGLIILMLGAYFGVKGTLEKIDN